MTLHYNSRFNPLISQQQQPDYHQVYQRSSVTSLGSVASGYSASGYSLAPGLCLLAPLKLLRLPPGQCGLAPNKNLPHIPRPAPSPRVSGPGPAP